LKKGGRQLNHEAGAIKMTSIRRTILRANAIFLVVASVSSLCMDVLGIFFGIGSQSRLVASAPYTGSVSWKHTGSR
jgi:hypothetical protein